MPESTNCRREEENALIITLLLIGGLIGFKVGWTSGRRDLLAGLASATRIIQHTRS